jgi:hypothetical protein
MPQEEALNSINRINLTRISPVRFWAMQTARAGYAVRYANKERYNPLEMSHLW